MLLSLIKLEGNAYGVRIREALESRLERSVSFGAVYTTLDRLLEKGMVSSYSGEPTPQRGGRAKKFFRLERLGLEALQHARRSSDAVWAISPIPGTR